MIEEYVKKFKKIGSSKRPDSVSLSIMRKLKDIPKVCRNHINRMASTKSNDAEKLNSGYREAFDEIFILLFKLQHLNNGELDEMFFDFIYLKFSKVIVIKIYEKSIKDIDNTNDEGKQKIRKLQERIEQTKNRSTNTSKAHHKALYNSNLCFKTIVDEIEGVIVSSPKVCSNFAEFLVCV